MTQISVLCLKEIRTEVHSVNVLDYLLMRRGVFQSEYGMEALQILVTKQARLSMCAYFSRYIFLKWNDNLYWLLILLFVLIDIKSCLGLKLAPRSEQ